MSHISLAEARWDESLAQCCQEQIQNVWNGNFILQCRVICSFDAFHYFQKLSLLLKLLWRDLFLSNMTLAWEAAACMELFAWALQSEDSTDCWVIGIFQQLFPIQYEFLCSAFWIANTYGAWMHLQDTLLMFKTYLSTRDSSVYVSSHLLRFHWRLQFMVYISKFVLSHA